MGSKKAFLEVSRSWSPHESIAAQTLAHKKGRHPDTHSLLAVHAKAGADALNDRSPNVTLTDK